MVKVSIIIPVYNVKLYLNDCVKNVLTQTFTDYEILLIDDGSTDTSKEECDRIALLDNRIKVFHKKNEGISNTRNFGLNKAKGKYIIFLDSDDYWSDDTILSILVEYAETFNLDIVRGEYYDVDEKGKLLYISQIPKSKLLFENKVLSSFEMIKYIIEGQYFLWLFLFRRDSINNLKFDEKRVLHEDIDFLIKYFCQDLKCGYVPVQFYAYRHRSKSITSTPKLSNLSDSLALTDVFYTYSHKVNDERLSQLYLYRGIMMYYWTLETIASNLFYEQYKDIEKCLDLKLIRHKVCSWIKETESRKFPIQLYVSPYIGVCLFRLKWKLGGILRFLKPIKG